MKVCDEYRSQIGAYLDDELPVSEKAAFEAHVAECLDCRAALDAERRFLNGLRSTRPLYTAPPQLRARVEEALIKLEHPESRGLRAIWERASLALGRFPSPLLRPATAFVLVCAILLGAWFVRTGMRRLSPPSELEAMAVQLHQQRLQGKLPLETQAASPAAISGWFQGKVPFAVHLPSYDEIPSHDLPFQIEGARLVSYRKDAAGYIAYRTGGRPVSLVTLPTPIAPRPHGKGVVMGKLTIFYDKLDDFHVITWAGPRSGLTYALVTDLEHPSQACVLCHASSSAKDRDIMRELVRQ